MAAPLSKGRLKTYRAYRQKKFRDREDLIVAEGEKIAEELLRHRPTAIRAVCALDEWWAEHPFLPPEFAGQSYAVKPTELSQLSTFKTPNRVWILADRPAATLDVETARTQPTLFLDGLQDPGNVGTILRTADWYGFRQIVCAPGTVDVFHPRTIQASMGAFLRVNAPTLSIHALHEQLPDIPLVATVLDGDPLGSTSLPRPGIYGIGNEGNGISLPFLELNPRRLTLPGGGGAESLNAAVATGILCSRLFEG